MDLSLITTEELVEEISKRFPAMVISILRDNKNDTDIYSFVRGNYLTCIALADRIKFTLNSQLDHDSIEGVEL